MINGYYRCFLKTEFKTKMAVIERQI